MIVDVRTKILLIFLANYLLFIRAAEQYVILFLLFLTGLFVLAKAYKKAVGYLLVFVVLMLLSMYVLERVTGHFGAMLSMLVIGGRLMLPCIMSGSYLLSTSTLNQVIHGLRKWRIPEKVVLTFAVMFRFLPVIKKDFTIIDQSLKMRGIYMTPIDLIIRPVRYAEYILVPLIMSSSRTANDLTIATMTKDIGGKDKSMYRYSQLTMIDYIILAIMVGIVVSTLIWR